VITGAFLAESASAVNNKLDVKGGVLARFMVGPDRTAEFVLVVLTQAERDNPDRLVEVEFLSPDGDEPRKVSYELPQAAAGGEIGFAYFPMEVSLPVDGRWVIVVTGGAGAISLPLLVTG
jgi:hypothetical protein